MLAPCYSIIHLLLGSNNGCGIQVSSECRPGRSVGGRALRIAGNGSANNRTNPEGNVQKIADRTGDRDVPIQYHFTLPAVLASLASPAHSATTTSQTPAPGTVERGTY